MLPKANKLEAAVEELLLSGFDRRRIGVLASGPRRSGTRGALGIPAISELKDDPGSVLARSSHPLVDRL